MNIHIGIVGVQVIGCEETGREGRSGGRIENETRWEAGWLVFVLAFKSSAACTLYTHSR
jgi:hypothetical protein